MNDIIYGFDPASPKGDYQAEVLARCNEDGTLTIIDLQTKPGRVEAVKELIRRGQIYLQKER